MHDLECESSLRTSCSGAHSMSANLRGPRMIVVLMSVYFSHAGLSETARYTGRERSTYTASPMLTDMANRVPPYDDGFRSQFTHTSREAQAIAAPGRSTWEVALFTKHTVLFVQKPIRVADIPCYNDCSHSFERYKSSIFLMNGFPFAFEG